MASSSSSSTLSAKARPFIPPQPRPSPLLPSSSSLSTLSPNAPPFSNSVSTSTPSLNPLLVTPYYPSCYDDHFNSDLLGFGDFPPSTYMDDDILETSCDYEDSYEGRTGPWNVPFDEEEVGYLKGNDLTSSWRVTSLDFNGGGPGIYEENDTFHYNISSASKSALLKETPSQLSILNSAKESSAASNSNSSYNFYMEQICQFSKDFVPCYPPESTSSQVNAPLTRGTSGIADFMSKSVSIQALPEESSTSQQKIKNGKGFLGDGDATNIKIYSGVSVDSPTMKEGLSSSLTLTKPIKLAKTLSSEKVSDKHDDSLENSTEALGEIDLDVDSPCWKGTLSHQQSPFEVDEPANLNLSATNSVGGNGVNLESCLDNPGNLLCDETKKVSSESHVELPTVTSHNLVQKCEEPYRVQSSEICKGQRSERTDIIDDNRRKQGAKGREVVQLDQGMHVTSVNQSRAEDEIATPSVTVSACGSAVFPGKALSVGEQTRLIDESLQYLRGKLMSRIYMDDIALRDLLNKVLQFVNDYPETSNFKMKKIDGLEQEHAAIHQSNICTVDHSMRKENGAIVNQSSINTSQDIELQRKMQAIEHHTTNRQGVASINLTNGMKEKFEAYSIQSNKSDKFYYMPSDLNIVKGMTNDFEKILRKTLCKKEDLEASLHKNLWIEAQVGLLSMKYQLQLAFTEIERLKHNQSIKVFSGRPQEGTRLSFPDGWPGPSQRLGGKWKMNE